MRDGAESVDARSSQVTVHASRSTVEHALHGCGLGPSAGDGRGGETEDVVRLSPLSHEHINDLGRYSFALADRIAQEELRPLHHPEDSDDLRIGAASRTFLCR